MTKQAVKAILSPAKFSMLAVKKRLNVCEKLRISVFILGIYYLCESGVGDLIQGLKISKCK